MSEKVWTSDSSWAPDPFTPEEESAFWQEQAEATDEYASEEDELELQHERESAAGLTPEQIAELDGPPQTDAQYSIRDRLPDYDDDGNEIPGTRRAFKDPQPEQAQEQAKDPDADADWQLYTLEQERLTAQSEFNETAVDGVIDDALIQADRDQTAEGIRQAVGESEQFYSVTHPDYPVKVQAAKLQYARDLAATYMAQGLPREVAMRASTRETHFLVYRLASDALAAGRDPAAYLDQMSEQYLGGAYAQPQAPAPRAQSHAQQIQSGQKAARGLGRGGTSPGGRGTPSTEEEISKLNGPEFERAYKQWLADQGVET